MLLPGFSFAALLLLFSPAALLHAQQSPPAPMATQQGGASTAGVYAPIHDAENRPITAGGVVEKGPVVFEDISRPSGLATWKYSGGTAAKALIVESLGGGVALLDYDNDGWLDIYLVNGMTYDALSGKAPSPHAALFHNNHDGTFTNVAEKAGVTNDRWGVGVAVGDYDNDGWPDLYVTNVGNNRLYHNNHDGTFTDVAEKAGVTLGTWSTGPTFGDYDGDGKLDLFVPGYAYYDFNDPPAAGSKWVVSNFCQYRGVSVFCGPRGLKGEHDHLFHNNGDGTFTDVSAKAGVADAPGYFGLTAVFADLNGDGLTDLIVVNNKRSKINLLYNQTGKSNSSLPRLVEKKELNALPPDVRFRIESIASEKRISSLVVADLNGDGKPDLAYYGEPKELVVQYNLGTNGWSAPKRWPIDDGQLSVNALAAGDLNGDKLTDLVLLGENNLYFLAQNPDHTLAEPKKIPFSGEVHAAQVLDINGDGRDDLLLVNWLSQNPFRFRLQNDQGELGPEIYFTLSPIRSYMADDLAGDHKTEVVTIAESSGRAAVSHFAQKPAEPLSGNFKQGQFQVLPLNKTTRGHRGILWADVNGDGLADLLVAEPDSGQLSLYLQKPDGTLAAAKTFPTFAGVRRERHAADFSAQQR